jgi:hypothetical protein
MFRTRTLLSEKKRELHFVKKVTNQFIKKMTNRQRMLSMEELSERDLAVAVSCFSANGALGSSPKYLGIKPF